MSLGVFSFASTHSHAGRARCARWLLCIAAAALLLAADIALGQRAVMAIGRTTRAPRDRSPGGSPLINTDEELQTYLQKAQNLIKDNQFDQAIEILQGLISHGGGGFVQSDDPARYVSLRMIASDTLGSLPPDGLKKYRSLYDAQAQRIYEQALADGDAAALQLVAERYLHTSYGVKALDALGAMYLDSGRCNQAANCWRRVVRALEKDASAADARALAAAKAATGMALAGDKSGLAAMATLLGQAAPQAQATLGGASRNLAEFVAELRQQPAVAASQPAAVANGKDYGGLGSLPTGAGLMVEPKVILMPRWSTWQEGDKPLVDPVSRMSRMGGGVYYGPYGGMMTISSTMGLRGGLVELRAGSGGAGRPMYRGSMDWAGPMPMAGAAKLSSRIRLHDPVHPLVVDGLVICRGDSDIEARDLSTGQIRWTTALTEKRAGRPIERPIPPMLYQQLGGGYGGQYRLGDCGRAWMTAAAGKVFVLHSFPYHVGNLAAMANLRQNPQLARQMADVSTLSALAADSGKVVWETGGGRGADAKDILGGCKFISSPTYAAGRLYVVATYMESFHLLCINAETGAMLWNSSISQTPMLQNYGYFCLEPENERGSPPAVADGKVYVATNSGVIAAFDADGGAALWAHQYGGQNNYISAEVAVVSNGGGMGAMPMAQQFSEFFPPNPLIVTQGRLICLPADGNELLILNADDGASIARVGRMGQRHLSYISDDRVLLSGQGLYVLSAADGAAVFSDATRQVVGRPAVTPGAVLASAESRIVRLSLPDFRITTLELTDGLLGNLVATQESLIAANAMGVCAYFDYERVSQMLDDAVAGAKGPARIEKLFERAIFCHNSARYDRAAADFDAVLLMTDELALPEVAVRARQWKYRTLVAWAAATTEPPRALELLAAAADLASTDQEKAHMMLRLAKAQAVAGDLAAAVETAQKLSDQYGNEQLVDYGLGRSGAVTQDGPDVPRSPGRTLAQAIIRDIRRQDQGAAACAAMDSQAKAAFAEARKTRDAEAMAAVAARWPNAACAGDALLTAAETYYLAAAKAKGAQAAAAYGKARWHLSSLLADADGPLAVPGTVALAYTHLREGRRGMARMIVAPLRSLPPQHEVAFADISGQLGELIKDIEGNVPLAAAGPASRPALRLPLGNEVAISGSGVTLLRDHDGNVPTWQGKPLALRSGELVTLDPSAASEEAAVATIGPLSVPASALQNNDPRFMNLLAGVAGDGSTLVVATRDWAAGYDLGNNLRQKWKKKPVELGAPGQLVQGAMGRAVLLAASSDGSLSCVDAASGNIRWRARLPGEPRLPHGPPMLAGGVAAVRSANGTRLTCYDLASGKLVRAFTNVSSCDVAGESLVIVVSGEVVSAWDFSPLGAAAVAAGRGVADAPLWARKYPMGAPRLLACNSQYAAMVVSGAVAGGPVGASSAGIGYVDVASVAAPGNPGMVVGAGARIEVLSVVGNGRPVATMAMPPGAGLPAPVDAILDGPSLYVAVTALNNYAMQYGYPQMVRGKYVSSLSLHKFDIASQKRAWSSTVTAGQMYAANYVLPLALWGGHVGVSVFEQQGAAETTLFDAATGQTVATAPLAQRGWASRGDAYMRVMWLCPPAAFDGALVADTLEGISIFRSPSQEKK